MSNCQSDDARGDALDASWSEIEAQFRVWSFHVYYDKLYAEELDTTLRFCKALVASSQPFRDRQKVIDWYVQRQRRLARRRRRKRGARADVASLPARGGGRGLSPSARTG